ncbi:ribosome maturation factor RimP [bacterium]|nr:MAG: ribosome maturation factor RimP [bacterium]
MALRGALAEAFAQAAERLTAEEKFAGLEIVDARARRRGREVQLTLVIDHPDGVGFALCERVSAGINQALSSFAEPYTLEVESPGLDRPLVKLADFARFVGQQVRVTTGLAVQGSKTHRGVLLGVNGENVVLGMRDGELPIPHRLIASANIEYDIRADLKRAKEEKT